jgi:hypothetical protein
MRSYRQPLMISVKAFGSSICHGNSQSKIEYRPNFKSKHFTGIIAAESEKEILTSLLSKNWVKSTLVHISHCDAVYKKNIQELAITTHFSTVIYCQNFSCVYL